MVSILTRLSRPLLQIGDLAFDNEVSVQRGGEREISERRLAAGVTVADHSRRPPRVYQVEGAVSAIAQPQNFGRPGAPVGSAAVEQLAANIASALLPIGLASRVEDFEARLDALLDDGQFAELELVSKVVGRVQVVLVRWEATTTGDDGDAATYRLTLREVQRAGLTIAGATPEALALNGSGGGPQPGGGGPSQATPGTLDVVP